MLSRLSKWLRHRWLSLVLAATAGVLYFVGFCGFDQFYLTWVCLVPILWALDDRSLSWREALVVAWFFGLITHLGGYPWIIGLLNDFGHLPWPLAFLGYFLLCLAQGTLLAAWGLGVNRLSVWTKVSVVWTAPVMMAVVEWVWPALFPSYFSNSQYRQITFIQTLDLWGPIGLGFILTLSSAVIYRTLAWHFRKTAPLPMVGWAVLVVLVVADLGYGFGATKDIDQRVEDADRRIRVGMVQTNMGIYEKDRNPREGLRRHLEQSLDLERQGAELIIWPESGYNYALWSDLKNIKKYVMGDINTPLLFGGIRAEKNDEGRIVRNTAFLADADGNVLGTYDKTYLLAFGEYFPFGEWFPILYKWSPHTARFVPGTHTNALVLDGIRYGIMVCYEDILPGFVRKMMRNDAQIMVNMTNDAWFGKSREPLIHLALATYRAVEHRRFLVRSTNTGITAVIDPAGRIVEQTPIFERANLLREVAPLDGTTIYAQFGEWVSLLSLMVLIWWLRAFIQPIWIKTRSVFKA